MSQAKLRQPAGHSADQRICSYLFLFLFLLLFNRRSVRATCWRDAAAIASNSSSKGPQKARPSQHRGGLLLPVQRPDGRLLYFAGLHGSWRLGPERQRDVHDHHDNSEFANRADAPPDARDSRGRGDRRPALFAIVGVVAHGSTTTSSRRPTRRDPGLSARELGEER